MTQGTLVELQRLLSSLCEGELGETEHARLDELLRADAGCRRVYLEYLDMHARLLTHPGLAARTLPLEQPTSSRPQPRWRQAGKYALVSAGTLAASLLIQVLLWGARTPEERFPFVPGEAGVPPPGYVATLVQAAGCVWENGNIPRQTGARLLMGELRLRQGLARLRFDSGPDLVLEGPAVLRLESSTTATVVRGKVVFQGNETAAPFELRTPSATLADLGTEYAVVVGAGGEEVHVFDGEVRRTPRIQGGLAAPEQLTAGQARHYGPAPQAAGQPVPLDPARFTRRVEGTGGPFPDPLAGLLAYEGFDYSDPDVLHTEQANGGRGWIGPWKVDFARPLTDGDPERLTLNLRAGLTRPDSQAAVGGCFEFAGFTKCFRRLATPVRLDADGVYYLSFLFRRAAPSDDPTNAVAVLLWTDEDYLQPQDDLRHRLNVGVGRTNELFTHLQQSGSRTPLPLSYGVTYLLVAKIVASGVNPDQVFMRVYGPDDPVDRDEPASWSTIGQLFESDLVFDWLQLHVNSKRRQTIDEVRLGTSWESVCGPWAKVVGRDGPR